MSEQELTTTSGSPVEVGPGDSPLHTLVEGPLLIVCISAPGEPEQLAFCHLGESPGYCMDRDTGMLRVWDRKNTHLVPVDRVRLLRITNAIRRG